MMKKIFAIICSVGLLTACTDHSTQTNVSVDEFEKAVADPNNQIVDVRTPGEYQGGHMRNAFLANWSNEEEFKERVEALDKKRPVYTYCLSGARSNAATRYLRENGFTAFNLTGGTLAWRNAGKTLEQAQSVQQISLAEYMLQIPADRTVLVDFSAVWCPPCKVMSPVIDSLVKTNGEQFTLVKIDGGQQSDICRELNVEAFPTFIIYKQGKETWRKEGIVDAKEITAHF